MKAKSLCLVLLIFASTLSLEIEYLDESPKFMASGNGCEADRNSTWTIGLIYCTGEMQSGYTLFSPMASNTSYLIDEYGREVHRWVSPGDHRPGLSAYLLDDGDLLRTANLGPNQPGEFTGGGSAGKIERISWDGVLEWSWSYSSEMYRSHHDIEPLPNGNVLMIAWEYRNETEAAEAGKYPQSDSSRALGTTSVWPDKIIEVQPIGENNAEIVWQWSFWDHLIQDYDTTKANYGVVADHPELLDVNFIDSVGGASGGRDWLHCNGIDYNEHLDQIAISCKNTNEIYIIDHSTTIEEATGHAGGNSGKGGDILYRYGNPESYQRGNAEDQVLFAQHDVQWIGDSYLDGGSLMIFNNGNGRETSYSSVDVITPPINGSNYDISSTEPYGPEDLTWTWDAGTEMYSSAISGSTRLSNGNTLITFGMQGTLIEVDYTGEIVWKYISPVNNIGIMTQGDSIFSGNGNKVFKVTRHLATEPALKGRELIPQGYIETWEDDCPNEESIPYDVDGDGCIDDTDGDGIDDSVDLCHGFDDSLDVDADNIPDGCDELIDNDGDGVANLYDNCEGYDDNIDQDNDTIPDGCDLLIDSDNDGVGDNIDACDGSDDNLDVDNDSIPDGCDQLIDADNDGIADDFDSCPMTVSSNGSDVDSNGCSLSQLDSDGDGVSDFDDECPNFDDSIDINQNNIPDGCETLVEESMETKDVKSSQDTLVSNYIIGGLIIVVIALFMRKIQSDNS
ncbi:MAG TPA: hypothetical protein HA354_04560 [Candidatus Poseidoniaceae archaeon]|nr:hypothetical protein [Euryarchaeota archaeon]DAC57920.1 MAG TPA: hypothetical protein D7I07_04535 [Candidatus Poseidoniales archaeon]HII37750.1 hypothetical protein [Candidatus Poseidoniaceae archaeon]